jgi:hypothetical protein
MRDGTVHHKTKPRNPTETERAIHLVYRVQSIILRSEGKSAQKLHQLDQAMLDRHRHLGIRWGFIDLRPEGEARKYLHKLIDLYIDGKV